MQLIIILDTRKNLHLSKVKHSEETFSISYVLSVHISIVHFLQIVLPKWQVNYGTSSSLNRVRFFLRKGRHCWVTWINKIWSMYWNTIYHIPIFRRTIFWDDLCIMSTKGCQKFHFKLALFLSCQLIKKPLFTSHRTSSWMYTWNTEMMKPEREIIRTLGLPSSATKRANDFWQTVEQFDHQTIIVGWSNSSD